MPKHTKKGYTVIEILVSLTVLSAVILGCASLIASSNNTLYDSRAENEVRSQTGDLIRFITREVQAANSFTVSGDQKKLTITTPDKTLTYEIDRVTTPPEGEENLGELKYNDKTVFEVDYENSSFTDEGNSVLADLFVIKSKRATPYIYSQTTFRAALRGGSH